MDIVTTIDRAGALGLRLAVVDGRLNVTGSKTAEAAALVRQLATMKAAVIAHLTTPDPAPMIANDSVAPDLHTADLHGDIWHRWLTADELATVRNRFPAMTLEARQDGERFKITASYRAGAELWTAPSGHRYAVR